MNGQPTTDRPKLFQPKKEKDAMIGMRLTTREMGWIRATAESGGLSVAAFMRLALEVTSQAIERGVTISQLQAEGIQSVIDRGKVVQS